MFLFTDASETHWSATFIRTSYTKTGKPEIEQNHEPLCFLSGVFSDASANWSVLEHERLTISYGYDKNGLFSLTQRSFNILRSRQPVELI